MQPLRAAKFHNCKAPAMKHGNPTMKREDCPWTFPTNAFFMLLICQCFPKSNHVFHEICALSDEFMTYAFPKESVVLRFGQTIKLQSLPFTRMAVQV